MDARYKYGYAQDRSKWPDCEVSINNITDKQERVSFYREKNSHKGISKFKNIKELVAKQVNQQFLLEISELSAVEYLSIEITTAEDISPLVQLPKLRFLKLDSVRKAKDFSAIVNHKPIECLFIQNAKHIDTLDVFRKAHHLKALGVEGGMYTAKKIVSLKPLTGLKGLEALFMSSISLIDKNLEYLASIPNLKVLECARFAPKKNFEKLRQLLPNLECIWCEKYEIEL